jgi:hypothetical protein
LREFQQDPENKSPGPVYYITDYDPGKILNKNQRPLTSKKTFIDE